MIDPSTVLYCAGVDGQRCGRYTTAVIQANAQPDKVWAHTPDGFMCPDCLRVRIKMRTRAMLEGGIRRSTRSMTPREREAAKEVLPQDLLEAVDNAWDKV